MKLCKCGCGKEVNSASARFISGHNIKKGHKWKPRSDDHIKKIINKRIENKKLNDLNIPFPLCKCGCGQRVVHRSDVYIKHHHSSLGFNGHHHTTETKKKMSIVFQSEEFQNKKSKTMIKRYGVIHAFQDDKFVKIASDTYYERTGYRNAAHNPKEIRKALRTRRNTNINRGIWISDDQLPLFQLYYKRVWYYTNISAKLKYTKDELSNRSLCGVQNGLQLDHKFSIRKGFECSILPYIIGSQCNIELISWEDNRLKNINCSITKKELFENVVIVNCK